MIRKDCPVCSKEFHTYPSINKVHCSSACSKISMKNRTYEKYKKTCEVCGVDFLPPRPKEGGRYCSYACSGLSTRKDKINRSGYIYIHKREHPRATSQGYIGQHVSLMEDSIGRLLNSDEVVHHIDHDRSNNELSNLQLMSCSGHKSMHMYELHYQKRVNTEDMRRKLSERMFKFNEGRNPKRGSDGRFK